MVIDVASLIVSSYGAVALFFLVFSASFVIIPVMGFIITSLGSLMPDPTTLIYMMFLLHLAAVLGDLAVYYLASKFSNKVLRFLKRWKWFAKGEPHSRRLYEKYGFWIVFISRFLNTELCVAINYISGLEKYNYKKFVFAVLLGEFLYIFGYMTFGYLFKETWVYLSGVVQSIVLKILLIIILIYLIYSIIKFIIKKWKAKK